MTPSNPLSTHTRSFNREIIESMLVILGLLMFSSPAHSNSTNEFIQCNQFHIEEHYSKGRINAKGEYRKGNVTYRKTRIPCNNNYQSQNYTSSHQYMQLHHPHQQPTRNQPIIINQSPNQPISRCDKLIRIPVLSAVGTGIGYWIGGGRKSSKTIRNSTIGGISGGILGAIIPC